MGGTRQKAYGIRSNGRKEAQETRGKKEDRGQVTGDRGRARWNCWAGEVVVGYATSRAEHSTGQEDLRLTDSKLKTPTGVEVIRVGTAAFTRASHWRRAWSYLTLYPQLMWQVWKLGRVDAVVSMTDPPLQVAAVTMAACRAGKKIHWAQDVYPELAEELGVIVRGGLFAGVLRAVSTWALRRQDEIVAVGRCMRERLVRRGIDAGRIEVIPNWSSVGAVSEEEVRAMREKLGWSGKFIALYSGNIGLAHDFETLVGAAKLLEGAGVQMVFRRRRSASGGGAPRYGGDGACVFPATASEGGFVGVPRRGGCSFGERAGGAGGACGAEQGLRDRCRGASDFLRGQR